MMDATITQEFVVQLISYACGRFGNGRDEDDPVYQTVTEGRDVPPFRKSYSSCGDLAHWLLFRLGSRLDLINRKEHKGFKIGRNVSKLAFSSLAENAADDDVYEAGDILIIWSKSDATDAHVMVVLAHRDKTLISGEYGQPGGAIRTHVMKKPRRIGKRTIHKVLRLRRVLEASENSSKLQEPDLTALPLAQAYLIEHQAQLPVEGLI